MKKFSNITGQKVGQEPKIENKPVESDNIKYKIIELMEQFLTVRMYGPVDRYQRAGSITIAGKEIFLEALLNLFNVKSMKEQTKLLESLKSQINDWQLIDNKVDEFQSNMAKLETDNNLLIQKNNILKIYNKFDGDVDMILTKISESLSKIKSPKLLEVKIKSAQILAEENSDKSELFTTISEKYQSRLNQIISLK